MAKKFRCSTCGNIVTIDPTVEVIACPHCGKKYRNIFYDPTATKPEQAPEAPAVEEESPVLEEEPIVLEEGQEEAPVESNGAEGEEDYYETEEYDEEAYFKRIAKLKAKRTAHVFTLLFSLVLLAATAFMLYMTIGKEGYTGIIDLFKGNVVNTFKSETLWVYILAPMPIVLVALGVFVLSAMHISVAGLKLKAMDSDADLSGKIMSARKAGYAFCLIFSIVALIYTGLMSVGAIAIDATSGGADILTSVQEHIGSMQFVEFVLSVIGLAYFAHRIDIAGRKYN